MKHTRLIAAGAAILLAGGAALAVAMPAAADDSAPVAAQTEGGASSLDSTSATQTTSEPTAPTSPSSEGATASASPGTESSDVSAPPTEPTESSTPDSDKSSATDDSTLPAPDSSNSSASVLSSIPPKGHDPITLCHKPGTPAQQTLTVDDNAVKGHLGHGDTLGECAPLPVPVEGWWIMPNGGTASHVTWPQTATTANNVPCGTTAQVDTYPSQAVLDGLAADGVLNEGEDYSVVISWRFVYGGDCTVTINPVTVNPPTCDKASTYTVPEQDPVVKYALDGETRPTPGTYTLESGQTAVVAAHVAAQYLVKNGGKYAPADYSITVTGASATGYQLTDPESACYVEPAQPKVRHAEYTLDACTKPLDGSRTVVLWGVDTTIPQLFDPKTGTFSDGEAVEGEAYVVATKIVNDGECVVAVIPAGNPPTSAQPVVPALAAPPAGPTATFGLLAQTGSNVDQAQLWVSGAVLLVALGLGAVGAGAAIRRRRAFRQVMSRLSSIK